MLEPNRRDGCSRWQDVFAVWFVGPCSGYWKAGFDRRLRRGAPVAEAHPNTIFAVTCSCPVRPCGRVPRSVPSRIHSPGRIPPRAGLPAGFRSPCAGVALVRSGLAACATFRRPCDVSAETVLRARCSVRVVEMGSEKVGKVYPIDFVSEPRPFARVTNLDQIQDAAEVGRGCGGLWRWRSGDRPVPKRVLRL